jgi:hypothetical protein
MSRTTKRATAALLCGVVLVALGFAIAGMPAAEQAPESLSVTIDFDPFVPGITKTRSSAVDVPVPSRVDEALVAINGSDAIIITDLAICQVGRCTSLVPGLELDPGPYSLTVAATMDASVEPGMSGEIVGQIRIVETHQLTAIDTTLLMGVAGVGLFAIATGALLVGRRKVLMP